MRTWTVIVGGGGLVLAAALASAQPPGGGPGPDGTDDLVTRMMEFDQNKDGKLTRTEVTDDRLLRLFDRADADQDGIVTRAELNALQVRERANERGGAGGPGGGFGPRGGGPGGFGPGGPGGGPPPIGQILPGMLQDRLNLTTDQKTQVEPSRRTWMPSSRRS